MEQNPGHALHHLQVNIFYQKILQSSVIELLQICENVAEENPFLEFERSFSHFVFPKGMLENLSAKVSFIDRIKMEIAYLNTDPEIAQVANLIAELIDDDGYLRFSVDEMCRMTGKDAKIVQEALGTIQSLEPPGIAARNFLECFMLQMKAKKMEGTPAFRVLCECGEDLIAGRFSRIKRKMKLTDLQFSDIVAEIRKLDPFPARPFSMEPEEIIPKFPDFIIRSIEPSISLEFVEDKISRIFINETYVSLMNNIKSVKVKKFLE